MYPPQSHYQRLATDPEAADSFTLFPPRKTLLKRFRPWRRTIFVGVAALFLFFIVSKAHKSKKVQWNYAEMFPNNKSFAFDHDPRPAWLDTKPVGDKLNLRVAVVSHTDEFDKRQAMREAVFLGVRKSDIKLDYRFFLGAPTGEDHLVTRGKLALENSVYGDLVILENIPDIKQRLSEKRYAAMKWGASVPHDSYDYFMTLDSDTFVRFGALARRMPTLLKDKNYKPREQRILMGSMGSHLVYFVNTVPDGREDPSLEDVHLKGPWYPYPLGIGYMLSSFLVKTFLSIDPPLPHHIHYPSDDVMIGSWIASLKLFPDTSIVFETTAESFPDEPVRRVFPEPYLPEAIDTEIFDDVEGWHNFIERDGNHRSFSWNSVCVHRVSANEMRAFRALDVIKGEWDE